MREIASRHERLELEALKLAEQQDLELKRVRTEKDRKQVIIAGHSHVHVFQFGGKAASNKGGLVQLPMPREEIYGFATEAGPWSPTYWDDLSAIADDQTILLFWNGSQYIAEFLFEQARPFDFVLGKRPKLPLNPNATLASESLVRSHQLTYLVEFPAVLDRLLARPGCRVYLCATPPPKGDDVAIRDFMMKEGHFQHWAKEFRLDLSNVPIVSPFTRLKLWHVMQDVTREIALSRGVPFIPLPAAIADENGFLRREYWEQDVAHANTNYGIVFFEHAMALVDEHRMQTHECSPLLGSANDSVLVAQHIA